MDYDHFLVKAKSSTYTRSSLGRLNVLNLRRGAIYLNRTIYGVDWFVIAPSLVYIAATLHLSVTQIGLVATGFYIGLVPSQLIGGVLSRKLGSRFISFIGMFLLGLFTFLTAYSIDFYEIFIFRILCGFGSSLFSSPALSRLSDYMTGETRGGGVGLYNSFFNVGAAIGFGGLAFVDAYIGWRVSLDVMGLISMGTALFLIPRTGSMASYIKNQADPDPPERDSFAGLIIISVSLVLASITEAVVGQLFVYYSVQDLKINLYIASAALSAYWVAGIFGALLFGRFSYMFFKRTVRFIFPVLLLALSYIVVSFIEGNLELFLVSITMGFLSNGILSILYLSVIRMSHDPNNTPLYLGVNNFIQKIIALGMPSLFAIISVYYSFRVSWITLAFIGIVPAIVLLLLRKFPGLETFNV